MEVINNTRLQPRVKKGDKFKIINNKGCKIVFFPIVQKKFHSLSFIPP